MPKEIRIVITENHTLTRKGYISLLKDIKETCLVGEAENGKQLLKFLQSQEADIALLDIEMPVMNGMETLKVLRKQYPKLKVIMVSFHSDESVMLEFIKQGAVGFISKNSTYEEFSKTILTVAKDGYYHNKVITKALLNEVTRKTVEKLDIIDLSERERDIIILTCQGFSHKEIAQRLNIVVKTVDYHKNNIYRKTKTNSYSSLYQFALKHELISEEAE